MKAFLPVLVLAGLSLFPPASALAQDGSNVLMCGYFDFNHDLSYKSHPFVVNGDANSPEVRAAYVTPFVEAIRAQYHVPVDLRHVWCDPVGPWRIDAERKRDIWLDANPSQLPANERRVDWPAGT